MVEFVPPAFVHATLQNVREARQRVIDRLGVQPQQPGVAYWETLFEANAAEVLACIPEVRLTPGFTVRYRFFGQRGNDLLVRPFVARTSTDVDTVRQLIDWHAAPDAVWAALRHAPTQDVELLYRHFSHPASPTGFFAYWVVMQELWASGRWAHSQVIATPEQFSQFVTRDGWEVVHPLESYEPAVVREGDAARLAVLVQCPLQRFEISLQQIDIAADGSLRYGEPILVAAGPRGYVM